MSDGLNKSSCSNKQFSASNTSLDRQPSGSNLDPSSHWSFTASQVSDLLTDREKSESVDTIKYQEGFISRIPAYFIKDNYMNMPCLQSV